MNRYLIFRTDRIGDFLLTLILIKNIKRNDKDSHISVICSKKNYDYIKSFNLVDKAYLFNFEIPIKERKHLIVKASICINGISLTISKVSKKGFQIWIIPHTYNETNLSSLKKKSLVNIEIDILSKYVRNYFNEKK